MARDLPRGVYATVCAARDGQRDALALTADPEQDVFDDALYGPLAGLDRPPGEAGPVVGDREPRGQRRSAVAEQAQQRKEKVHDRDENAGGEPHDIFLFSVLTQVVEVDDEQGR